MLELIGNAALIGFLIAIGVLVFCISIVVIFSVLYFAISFISAFVEFVVKGETK